MNRVITTLRRSPQLAWLALACLAVMIGIGLAGQSTIQHITNCHAAKGEQEVILNPGTLRLMLTMVSRDLRELA